MVRLLIVSTAVCMVACNSEIEALANCAPTIAPVASVAPSFPPRLHNSFEGRAEIEIEVAAQGDVHSARILSAQWSPVGNARGEPVGYEEAILSAVSQWRYAPMAQRCVTTTRIEFRFEQ